MRTHFLALLFAIGIILSASFPTGTAHAVPGLPSGGPIIWMIPCTCSGTLWIYMGPPISVPPADPFFMLTPATVMFAFDAVHPGAFLTDDYAGLFACIIVTGWPPCTPIGAGKTILYTGTSV